MTRIFGVDYAFLSCGSVFTDGLVHAAAELGVDYQHALWDVPDLPARVQRFRPDLLFVVHGRKFARRFRDHRLAPRSAVWLLDEPYEVDETSQWSSKQFDVVGISDPATLHRHTHAFYLPVCYDPVAHTPGTGFRPHAVGFIGGGNGTRDRYLTALAQCGLLTYVIGGPWPSPSVQRLCRSGNIPASETPTWYRQTRIVLNVFREIHHYNREKIAATSLNPRVYEALACGALVVSEWRPEVETVVPSLPTFRTIDECVTLIADLLDDPAKAEAIRQQCAAQIAPHTYAARLQTVLQAAKLEVAA